MGGGRAGQLPRSMSKCRRESGRELEASGWKRVKVEVKNPWCLGRFWWFFFKRPGRLKVVWGE